MKTVLVAEDESAIREFIVINLERAGYQVYEAENGAQAITLFERYAHEIDIALLDIMMPVMDGLAACRGLRERSDTLGIIMLTARSQEMDRVNGLMLGADDYITKPFSPSELVARVDALYRRVELIDRQLALQAAELVVSGDFALNTNTRILTHRGEAIELTHVECQFMECFMKNPDKALSRTDILNQVWGSGYFGEEKIVDVNVRRLRMKIEEEPSSPTHIVTVWGMGYKWQA